MSPRFLASFPVYFRPRFAILSPFKGHTPVTTTRRLTISVSFFFRLTRVRYRENNRFFFFFVVYFLFRENNNLLRYFVYFRHEYRLGERSTRPDNTWRFSRVQPGNAEKTHRDLWTTPRDWCEKNCACIKNFVHDYVVYEPF